MKISGEASLKPSPPGKGDRRDAPPEGEAFLRFP